MSAFTDWIHRSHLRTHERPPGTFGPDDKGVQGGCTVVCDWLEDPEAALPEARERAARSHEKFNHPGPPEACESPHDVLCRAAWAPDRPDHVVTVVEEMWPASFRDPHLRHRFAPADICLRYQAEGRFFTTTDEPILRTRQELYNDGWRTFGDEKRWRRMWVGGNPFEGDPFDGSDWSPAALIGKTVITDWEGAIQDPPFADDAEIEQFMPLMEAKMIHHYDIAHGGYDARGNFVRTKDRVIA